VSDSGEFHFEATVQPDGTFKPASVAFVRGRMAQWAGKRVWVEVRREKRRRSDAQHRLLFGPIYDDLLEGLRGLAAEAGEKCPFKDKEALHSAMKYLFLGTTVVKVPGAGELEMESSSKTLTTEQFSEFVSKILRWGAERGIYCRTGLEEWSA
jgi:hypothetical protein